MRYYSDCHLAPVTDVDGEMGICTVCKQTCWACEPDKLKPISFEQLMNSGKKPKPVNGGNDKHYGKAE